MEEKVQEEFPGWVKNPKPSFWQSFIFFLLIPIVSLLVAAFWVGVTGIEEITSIIKVLLKIMCGVLATFAFRPTKTPIWLFPIMLVLAFLPIACYVPYYFCGKYFTMVFTKPKELD